MTEASVVVAFVVFLLLQTQISILVILIGHQLALKFTWS